MTRRHWRELLLSLFVLLPGALFSIGNINMIIGDVGLQEDAFYYFTIARRFVSGDGFTLDGTNLTNGFHPLHMLLLLPGASFCSLLGFLRYALLLGVLIHLATTLTLYRLACRLVSRNLAFFTAGMWALALASRAQHLNGMETGAFLLLFCLVNLRYHDALQTCESANGKSSRGNRQFLKVGLLLGCSYLARVDAVFVGLALALNYLVRARGRAVVPLCHMAAGVLIIVIPWLLVSWTYFGNPLPESGPASRLAALAMGDGYFREMFSWSEEYYRGPWWEYSWRWTGINLWFFCAMGTTWAPPLSWLLGTTNQGILTAIQAKPVVELWLSHPILVGIIFSSILLFIGFKAYRWGVGCVYAAAVMIWVFHAIYPAPPWYSVRYMASWTLALTLLTPFVLRRLLAYRAFRYLLPPLAAALVAVYVLQFVNMYPRKTEPRGYHAEAVWMNKYLPPRSVVGTFQAGIISYFARHRVVNLDGVVNHRAYRALLDKQLGEYIREEGIDHVADWEAVLNKYLWPRAQLVPDRDLSRIHEGWYHYWQVLEPDR